MRGLPGGADRCVSLATSTEPVTASISEVRPPGPAVRPARRRPPARGQAETGRAGSPSSRGDKPLGLFRRRSGSFAACGRSNLRGAVRGQPRHDERPGRASPSSPPSVHGRGVVLPRRRRHFRRRCFFSLGCITRIVPMSQVALSRTTGKPGIGGSRAVSTTPLLPTGRTSRPRGTMTVIAPIWVWTTISTSQSSNSAWLRSIVTEPIPMSILVRRLTCQRPSRRTSPIEVEISSGS